MKTREWRRRKLIFKCGHVCWHKLTCQRRRPHVRSLITADNRRAWRVRGRRSTRARIARFVLNAAASRYRRALFVAFWNSIFNRAGQAGRMRRDEFLLHSLASLRGQRDIARIVAGELLCSRCRDPDELCYCNFFTVLCLAGSNRQHSVFRFAHWRAVLDLARQRHWDTSFLICRVMLHG